MQSSCLCCCMPVRFGQSTVATQSSGFLPHEVHQEASPHQMAGYNSGYESPQDSSYVENICNAQEIPAEVGRAYVSYV